MKHMIRMGLAMCLLAGVAVAQNPPVAQPKVAQPKVQAPAAGQAGQPGQPGAMMRQQPNRQQPNRQQLEQQIRDRLGNQIKKGLNLSDDQYTKLQATNKRFEEKRHLLVEQERDARMSMRDLMISGDTANAAKVSAGLDKMLLIQRQRFESIEQEQKELAGYLTPMQRARFLGMQEQMRRRMDALRAQGGRGGRPGGPGGAMGGRGMGQQGMRQGMKQGMGPGMGQGMGPGMMGQPGMGNGMRNNMKRPMGQGQPPVPPVPPIE
jgi:hypothetical protein